MINVLPIPIMAGGQPSSDISLNPVIIYNHEELSDSIINIFDPSELSIFQEIDFTQVQPTIPSSPENLFIKLLPVNNTINNEIKILKPEVNTNSIWSWTWNKILVPVGREIADWGSVFGRGIGGGLADAAKEIWKPGSTYTTAYQADSFYDPYLVGGGDRLPSGLAPNEKGAAIRETIAKLFSDNAKDLFKSNKKKLEEEEDKLKEAATEILDFWDEQLESYWGLRPFPNWITATITGEGALAQYRWKHDATFTGLFPWAMGPDDPNEKFDLMDPFAKTKAVGANLRKELTSGWDDWKDGDMAEGENFAQGLNKRFEQVDRRVRRTPNIRDTRQSFSIGPGGPYLNRRFPFESPEMEPIRTILPIYPLGKYVTEYSPITGKSVRVNTRLVQEHPSLLLAINSLREAYETSIVTENESHNWGLDAQREPFNIPSIETIEQAYPDEPYIEHNEQLPLVTQFPVIADYRRNLLELEPEPTNPDNSAEDNLLAKLTNRRSAAAEAILNSGPDFMKHMFDVMLVCSREDNKGAFSNFFDELYESSMLQGLRHQESGTNNVVGTGNIFMVRTAAITVPQMESDTFELKVGYETVKKVRSKVKYERKAELKVLLDEPLFFMSVFNLLSNNNKVIFNNLSTNNRYPIGFAPLTANNIVRESVISKQIRLDIIIKHQQLMNNTDVEYLKYRANNPWYFSSNELVKSFAGLQSKELPLWWFEDVTFLGQSEGLTFGREDSTIQEMSFPFLFKRCIKIDRQFRHGINQTALFDGNELKDSFELRNMDETILSRSFAGQSYQEWYYGQSN